MKTCSKCNLTFADDVNHCTQCGSPLAAASAASQFTAPPANHTASFTPEDISENKVLAMIPYLMGWIGILITLLAAGSSAYAGFHVRQALKIQVCSTLVMIIGAIIPVLGWIAIGIFSVVVLVLNIICFFSVCKGEAKEPPIIANVKFLK